MPATTRKRSTASSRRWWKPERATRGRQPSLHRHHRRPGRARERGIVLTASFLASSSGTSRALRSARCISTTSTGWRSRSSPRTRTRCTWPAPARGGASSRLAPQELIEATVWEALPAAQRPKATARDLMRCCGSSARPRPTTSRPSLRNESRSRRSCWCDLPGRGPAPLVVFGHYRHSDDMVLHAVDLPTKPRSWSGEPLETWLFPQPPRARPAVRGVRRSNPGSLRRCRPCAGSTASWPASSPPPPRSRPAVGAYGHRPWRVLTWSLLLALPTRSRMRCAHPDDGRWLLMIMAPRRRTLIPFRVLTGDQHPLSPARRSRMRAPASH